jgi:hypothetical protein
VTQSPPPGGHRSGGGPRTTALHAAPCVWAAATGFKGRQAQHVPRVWHLEGCAVCPSVRAGRAIEPRLTPAGGERRVRPRRVPACWHYQYIALQHPEWRTTWCCLRSDPRADTPSNRIAWACARGRMWWDICISGTPASRRAMPPSLPPCGGRPAAPRGLTCPEDVPLTGRPGAQTQTQSGSRARRRRRATSWLPRQCRTSSAPR